MTTFNLTNFSPEVPVNIPDHLSKTISPQALLNWRHFNTWHTTLKASLDRQNKDEKHPFHSHPYTLKKVDIQSIDFFGPNLGFVKLIADVSNDKGVKLPGVAFLRGSAVAMLMILRPSDSRDERWVVMTEQPRVPSGSLTFMEIPAGMMDDVSTKEYKSKAVDEIKEETGLDVPASELINMTELALKGSSNPENLGYGMYPSPGGSDEYIVLFLWEKELDRQEIVDLRGKLTGETRQGEMITLKLLNYEDLWRVGARDAKTLAAWSLYEALKRSRDLAIMMGVRQ